MNKKYQPLSVPLVLTNALFGWVVLILISTPLIAVTALLDFSGFSVLWKSLGIFLSVSFALAPLTKKGRETFSTIEAVLFFILCVHVYLKFSKIHEFSYFYVYSICIVILIFVLAIRRSIAFMNSDFYQNRCRVIDEIVSGKANES